MSRIPQDPALMQHLRGSYRSLGRTRIGGMGSGRRRRRKCVGICVAGAGGVSGVGADGRAWGAHGLVAGGGWALVAGHPVAGVPGDAMGRAPIPVG